MAMIGLRNWLRCIDLAKEKNQYDRNNFGNEPIGFDDNPLMQGQGNYPRVPWA